MAIDGNVRRKQQAKTVGDTSAGVTMMAKTTNDAYAADENMTFVATPLDPLARKPAVT
ncbi:hypothetical protein OH492_03660 [Vibrio chagasii]|nr:hypothetical protein [Vibrio chagasii]